MTEQEVDLNIYNLSYMSSSILISDNPLNE